MQVGDPSGGRQEPVRRPVRKDPTNEHTDHNRGLCCHPEGDKEGIGGKGDAEPTRCIRLRTMPQPLKENEPEANKDRDGGHKPAAHHRPWPQSQQAMPITTTNRKIASTSTCEIQKAVP